MAKISQSLRYIYLGFSVAVLSACTAVGLWAVNSPAILGGGYSIETRAYGPLAIQRLDIYWPDNAATAKGAAEPPTAKAPAAKAPTPKAPTHKGPTPKGFVFFIHGGRWTEGKKEDYRFIGAYFAQQGYVVIIPNYRKYPQVKFPELVDDAAKALAYASTHIDGVSQHRLHLMGHSSGAHVGALLAADARYLAREGKKVNDVIASFVGIAGPYAFTPDAPDLIDMFGPPEKYPQMQASNFIDGTEPAMLLLWGQKDNLVGTINIEKMQAAINSKHGKATIISYPALDHVSLISTFSKLGPKSDLPQDVLNFIAAHKTP